MSTTIYDVGDLTNINRVGTLTNIIDAGTGINADLSGSDSDSSLANGTYRAQCRAIDYLITADVDHAHPINPLPANAQIQGVTIRFNVVNTGGSCNSDVTVAAGVGAYVIDAISNFTILPQLDPDLWSTVTGYSHSSTNEDTLTVPAIGSVSNSVPTDGQIVEVVYDFTTNPNGEFPAGYMTYADFISFFATIVLKFNISLQGVGSTGGGPTLTGTGDATLAGLSTNNWEMEVVWQVVPTWWTPASTNIDVTNPVVEVTIDAAPTDDNLPGLSPGVVKEIHFNTPDSTCVITPISPYVIQWQVQNPITDTVVAITTYTLKFFIAMCALNVDASVITIFLTIEGARIPSDDGLSVVEFSGSVPLGAFTITYADLSGIYELDDTVHTDTLYDRSNTEVPATVTYAIPAPNFVTAFIGDNEIDISHYNGTRMRVTGSGTLKQIFQSLDSAHAEFLPDLTIAAVNNVSPYRGADFIDQNAALRVYVDGEGDYFNISTIVIFASPLYTDYPQ